MHHKQNVWTDRHQSDQNSDFADDCAHKLFAMLKFDKA